MVNGTSLLKWSMELPFFARLDPALRSLTKQQKDRRSIDQLSKLLNWSMELATAIPRPSCMLLPRVRQQTEGSSIDSFSTENIPKSSRLILKCTRFCAALYTRKKFFCMTVQHPGRRLSRIWRLDHVASKCEKSPNYSSLIIRWVERANHTASTF